MPNTKMAKAKHAIIETNTSVWHRCSTASRRHARSVGAFSYYLCFRPHRQVSYTSTQQCVSDERHSSPPPVMASFGCVASEYITIAKRRILDIRSCCSWLLTQVSNGQKRSWKLTVNLQHSGTGATDPN